MPMHLSTKAGICFILLCYLSCVQKKRAEPEAKGPAGSGAAGDSILIRQVSGNQGNPDSCIIVSYTLESDTAHNHFLRDYLCHYTFGHDTSFPTDQLREMAGRKSFYDMILLFYDGDKYSRVHFDVEDYRMDDLRSEYFYPIIDCCSEQVYPVIDALLQRGYFNGVEQLWSKADLRRLPSMETYLNKADTTNFYLMAELAAFFHNTGDRRLQDVYLAKAERMHDFKKEYGELKALFATSKFFPAQKYNTIMFGEK